MAQVFDPSSGQWIEVPDEQVTALVGSGKAYLPKGRVPVVDSRGVVGEVPAEDAPQAFANGFRYRSATEIQKEQEREEFEDRPIAAGVAGAARGATLGLSDAFLTEIGATRPETLRGLEDYNPEASIGGEVLGVGATVLASGGSAAPAAVVERVGTRIGVAAAERLGGGAITRGAAKGAFEGGLAGLGRAVTDAAQERDPLTAEKALASTATGALFGLGAGAIFGAAEQRLAGRPVPAAASAVPDEHSAAAPPTTTPEPPASTTAGGAAPPLEPPQPPAGAASTPPPPPAGPFSAEGLADSALGLAKPVKEAIEKNPGVFRRVFGALDITLPDADEFVLRGIDVKKKGMNLLREKGLEKSAPAALRADPRFAAVKNQEDAARLIATKAEESGAQVRDAAAKLDALVTPDEQMDVAAFVAKAEQELIAPLVRGTVDEQRAGARLRRELRALQQGLTPEAPPVTPRKAGVYEVPIEELDDVPSIGWEKGRLASVNRGLDEGKTLPAIQIGQGDDGLRELGDGNHRLTAARARGQKTIRVEFDSDEAAAINPGRPRGSHINPKAIAPMDSRPQAAQGRATFASVEEWKRRLDKSLRWDSTTPNEVRDQLRQLRGLLNRTQEETAERVSKKVGASAFQEWKKAKTLYGQMAELDNIATERLADAKPSNRLFSLTDNLAGVAGAVAGGGLNPVGLATALGAALLNKWGRENLPFVMARAMADYDNNPGARQAAQALVNRLRRGPDAGAAPVGSPPPIPPSGPGGAAIQGALLGMVQRAAQQGPREAWVAHNILSGSEEYRATAEREGLAQYTPDADAEGQRRAGAVSRVEQAAADFDRRADAATKGILSGRRKAVRSTATPDALAKAEEIQKAAADPEGAVERVAERVADLGVDAPGLASEMQSVAQRGLTFLASKTPARPASPLGDIAALRTPWTPAEAEVSRWTAYLRAVEDPASVLEDAASGRLTPEAVEALGAVYPALLADLRGRVVEQIAAHPRRLDYQQRLSLGLLLGMELDASMAPQAVASIQMMLQQQPERPQARPSTTATSTQKRIESEFSPSDGLTERTV